MNMEDRCDERLWKAINSNFENRNYTGAIQDCLFFITDLIREKSDIEDDGISLIDKVFNPKNPILKINNNETQTEKSIQQGFHQLLRGLILGIRNPRAHQKHIDNEFDAVAIILFVNMILKYIDQSKTPFIESSFLSRILDTDFVPNEEYADFLVTEIPKKKKMDIFYSILKNISEYSIENLHYFFKSFLKTIDDEQSQEIIEYISDDLKYNSHEDELIRIIKSFSCLWESLDLSARMRIENKLFRSINIGSYDAIRNKCLSGGFGTYLNSISDSIIDQKKFFNILRGRLVSESKYDQHYILRYFSSILFKVEKTNDKLIIKAINDGLSNGDILFYRLVEWAHIINDQWVDQFSENFNSFNEIPITYDDDHIPF